MGASGHVCSCYRLLSTLQHLSAQHGTSYHEYISCYAIADVPWAPHLELLHEQCCLCPTVQEEDNIRTSVQIQVHLQLCICTSVSAHILSRSDAPTEDVANETFNWLYRPFFPVPASNTQQIEVNMSLAYLCLRTGSSVNTLKSKQQQAAYSHGNPQSKNLPRP